MAMQTAISSDVTSSTAIKDFERNFAEHRRRTRLYWAVGTLMFFVIFYVTALIGDFFKVTQVSLPDGSREWMWIIPAGIPRLGEYISQTIPHLSWDTLGADLANWFWRWPVWMNLLFETILIAFHGDRLWRFWWLCSLLSCCAQPNAQQICPVDFKALFGNRTHRARARVGVDFCFLFFCWPDGRCAGDWPARDGIARQALL